MTVMTINSDEASAAMTFFVMLVIDGFAAAPADLESTWGGEALVRGRAAMAIEGNWVAPFLKRNYPDLDFGVAELPVGPQGRATPAFATCFAIPVDAQNRQAAERLVDYLMNPATLLSLTETGYAMPPRLSLHERWLQMNPEQQPFLNSLAYAQPWRFGARFMPLFSTVNSGLQQAFLSVRSVADILAEADGVGNRALAQ
jgi:multiple sugar transport system substrate-binding protein